MRTNRRIALIACCAIAAAGFQSCDNAQRDADRTEAMSELRVFVDSVDNEIENEAMVNWMALENRFERLREQVQVHAGNTDEEFEVTMNQLAQQFETAKENGQESARELNQTADKKINDLEAWFEERGEDISNTADDTGDKIEDGWEESQQWFEENYEKLEEGTQKRWKNLKDRMDNNG